VDGKLTAQQKLFYECYSDLEDFCFNDLSVISIDEAFDDLSAALPSCTATNTKQFLAWAKKQLRLSLEKNVSTVREMDFGKVLAIAEKHKQGRADTKPMKFIINGDAVLIDLTDRNNNLYVWVIPADWLSGARAIWPVFVKRDKNGPYVAKKSRRKLVDETSVPVTLRVHKLFVGGPDWLQVRARDGNYLNYLDGNLYAVERIRKAEKFVSLEAENVVSPPSPASPDPEAEKLPAKSTRVPNYDDFDEVEWVRQCHSEINHNKASN
jgi:hypothetical protein